MTMTDERARLIVSHIHKVEILARRIVITVPWNVSCDDLIGYGMEGLIKAANRYDSSRGFKFSTYAETIIRYAILDGLREMGGKSRGRGIDLVFFSELSAEDENGIKDLGYETLRPIDAKEPIEIDLTPLVGSERNVIENYYYKNKTMAEIGKGMDRTESRVSQIHKKAISKLRMGRA